MKKTILSFTLFTLLFALVACGGSSDPTISTDTSTSLSPQEELLIGTFKLEATDLAVSSDQASQLLPLWQMMQSLTASGTAATEEINAVVTRIKSSMSSQQISAITAMELTQQDLVSIMTENGLTANSSAASSTSDTNSVQGPMGDAPTGAAGDPGAGIPGGAGDPSGTGSVPSVITTSQTDSSQSQGSSSQDSTSLLSALIVLLQKKVQS